MAAENQSQKYLWWIAGIALIAAIVYLIVSRFFPMLVTKALGGLIGMLVAVTGLFLRRRRS